MKRKPDKTGITKFFPLFGWYECVECGFEYRREWIWRIEKGPFFNGRGLIRYSCRNWSPTKDNAVSIFKKYIMKISRPPPPPPPPPNGRIHNY